MDDEFARIIEDRSDESKSPEKLKNLLEAHKSTPEETKRKFSGPTLDSLPRNRSDIQWAEKALHELFSDSHLLNQLRESGEQTKKLNLEFKYPMLCTEYFPLKKGHFKIRVSKDIFRSQPQYGLDSTKSYFLRILVKPDADIRLEIEETRSEYILSPKYPEGGN